MNRPENTGNGNHTTVNNAELSTLAKCFADQVNVGCIPQPEPDLFTRNALTYPPWKAAFETLNRRKESPTFRKNLLSPKISRGCCGRGC